ncbi:MAG: 2-hydroxychromene-2-carboxylate isomerase [Rhodocyclaceae bacterium]|nr:2-hydroxychromene-2-carboxylate isomerase [Rhodocyclaceae bacterium]
MAKPIAFYFDFTSPYSYLASEKIDAIAEKYGRQVQWRPVLLGAIFKALGTVSLVKQPGMADYSARDFARSARFMDVPYVQPDNFPVSTVAAARAYYWLHGQDCALARRFAHAVFRAYFAEGRDISDVAVVLELGLKVGAGGMKCPEWGTALESGMQDPAIKERLRVENEAVLALGAFGAPWIIVDGEPFWGADRLPQIERWLEADGF